MPMTHQNAEGNKVAIEIEGSERPALVAETVTLFYL